MGKLKSSKKDFIKEIHSIKFMISLTSLCTQDNQGVELFLDLKGYQREIVMQNLLPFPLNRTRFHIYR